MFCFPKKFEFKTRISVERKKKQKKKRIEGNEEKGKEKGKRTFEKWGCLGIDHHYRLPYLAGRHN